MIRGFLTNVTLSLVVSVVALCMLEIASPFIYRAIRGRSFDRQEALARLGSSRYSAPEETTEAEVGMTYEHVLHPYLGFVGFYSPTQLPGATNYVNSYGFNGLDPIQKRSPNTLVVGIFGGSVANLLYQTSRGDFIKRLTALYPTRQIKFVCGALAGYKQPQQLMALTYFLTLGCEFDVVINVDGFNEVALPYRENVLAGVHPVFPRSWSVYARKALDKRIVYKVSEISSVQDHRATLARIAGSPVLRRSSLALMILRGLDERAADRLTRLNAEIQSVLTDERSRDFQVTGPEFNFSGLEQLFDVFVAVWNRSSQQMARLARTNGFRYYHFLQPNQYDPGSKVLTANELARAYLPQHPWCQAVKRGYPLLRASGRELSTCGVAFSDLSMLFCRVTGDIYVDTCCHYNGLGNRMLAAAIMDTVVADLKARGLADVSHE